MYHQLQFDRKEVFETVGLFNEEIKTNDDTEMYLRIAEKWKLFHIRVLIVIKEKDKVKLLIDWISYLKIKIELVEIAIFKKS